VRHYPTDMNISWNIATPDGNITASLREVIDHKTKPLGALGQLEHLALQIGTIQQTLTPSLENPHIVVFAGDHGISTEGVSAYPQAVTQQMVLNFLAGGAAINVFARQHNLNLTVVDAGVAADIPAHENLIAAKINYGTQNFRYQPAMTVVECEKALTQGSQIVADISKKGCKVIGLGEMGIGNTSSASALMSVLLDIPVAECTGRGTGVHNDQLAHKIQVLENAITFHTNSIGADLLSKMQTFGGFEIIMMCGAMLQAAESGMILLIDGFIATVAYLCAFSLYPSIRSYAIFCHRSQEQGHQSLLTYLQAKPLLHLDMRLGEGTGCALAYPLLESAVRFLNEMASFDDAGVSGKL